ncbi:bifunctional deaminase-reductase domain protein [Kribbella flavida DSM 17836]|uniref:Bifunctional deaminase-reductase domain protein n=1 Tax=Kribbella flavida (strain DSM 17836 / JCM 10339 / NBRC 14399) TaxID=479435 RepID=D2Q397_KRIFD|nr:dihydrofolate reductase family protein [Kribbella flavida]ADB32222.1 bifunctional deaminase-reductase domain protein [Kribbella flavida DSM 17836]
MAADGDRPRVVVSVNTSVDGRVALRAGEPLMDEAAGRVWNALSPPSAAQLDKARAAQLAELYQPQAVLEGSGSFVPDTAGPLEHSPRPSEPSGEELYSDFWPEEVVGRAGREKWFVVVDGRGRIRWEMKSQGEYDVLVLVARATSTDHLAYLRRERIAYLVAGEHQVDLGAALRRMREQLGVTCVVSTAGGGLNGALLRADLVDELHLLVSPSVVGGLGTPTAFDGPQLGDDEAPRRLRLLAAHAETDGMLWLRYQVLRDPPEH